MVHLQRDLRRLARANQVRLAHVLAPHQHHHPHTPPRCFARTRYLVQQGCIKPLCDLLTCNDPRLVTVALEGIENVLKAGEHEATTGNGTNPYTAFVDEAEGLDKLEQLQTHNNEEVYKKAVHILETYFGLDDDEDEQIAPEANQQGFVFQGQQPAGPPGGYQFG